MSNCFFHELSYVRGLDLPFLSLFSLPFVLPSTICLVSWIPRIPVLWTPGVTPYPLSLIPTTCSLSPSAVTFKKFRWALFLSLSLLSLLLLSPVKVKSTPICSLAPVEEGGYDCEWVN